MNDLVRRLSEPEQAVEMHLVPARDTAALRHDLEQGFVHVTFTGTRGGTTLGFALDHQDTVLRGADLEAGTGTIRIAGRLNLDGSDVKVIADIDIALFKGVGRLVPLNVPAGAGTES